MDAAPVVNEIADEKRPFRFIISPEDGTGLDLKEFTRQLMAQVEEDTGRRLIWAAVNHHNTDNPHVHIVVRGVDRDGDEVRIDGRYIGQEMRWRAQEIVTRELGPRPERELSYGPSPDINRDAFTTIDRTIALHQSADKTMSPRQVAEMPASERPACFARLEILERMNLARRQRGGDWHLDRAWETTLKEMGAHAEALERLTRAVPTVPRECLRVVSVGKAFEPVEGVIKAKGLDDELSGEMYAAVETPARASYYVRLRPEVAHELREGEKVRLTSPSEKWVKANDHILVKVATRNAGVYAPALHQRALQTAARAPGPATEPTPADLVAANVRRLERLERYGLVTRLARSCWRIPGDLVAQLEARERTHPRHHVQVERLESVRQFGQKRGREISRCRGPEGQLVSRDAAALLKAVEEVLNVTARKTEQQIPGSRPWRADDA
jgi:type IV secretory pathway VirD2 relaxase